MRSTIREMMSKDVAAVTTDQSIQEAAALMSQYNVGSLPVVQNGQIKGIVTDRDITLRSTAAGKDTHVPVSQVMTSQVVSATPEMDMDQAAQLMSQNQIRRLPVVENNQIVGMVALGDMAVKQPFQDEAEEALASISVPTNSQSKPAQSGQTNGQQFQ
ncbi:CBS domain-containing protein [Bacillus marinisedimentorum]|uniref:CBS domain-containing protein n=1 Tax=Bacillus marinisedimentorum TaxID=1821260 RepID=UPI0007DEDB76